MKVVSVTVAGLIALFQTTSANFDVYHQGVGGSGVSGNAWGYQVYQQEVACGDVVDWIWKKSTDVSSGYGVRCKGSGCQASSNPSDVEELEMRFNSDEYHWTIYKNRDWGFYDTDGNKVGNCMPYAGDDFYCSVGLGRVEGVRAFRCLTNSYNAADIRGNRP